MAAMPMRVLIAAGRRRWAAACHVLSGPRRDVLSFAAAIGLGIALLMRGSAPPPAAPDPPVAGEVLPSPLRDTTPSFYRYAPVAATDGLPVYLAETEAELATAGLNPGVGLVFIVTAGDGEAERKAIDEAETQRLSLGLPRLLVNDLRGRK